MMKVAGERQCLRSRGLPRESDPIIPALSHRSLHGRQRPDAGWAGTGGKSVHWACPSATDLL